MVNIFLSKVISSPPTALSSHEHLCFIVIYVVKHLHLPHSNNLTLFILVMQSYLDSYSGLLDES